AVVVPVRLLAAGVAWDELAVAPFDPGGGAAIVIIERRRQQRRAQPPIHRRGGRIRARDARRRRHLRIGVRYLEPIVIDAAVDEGARRGGHLPEVGRCRRRGEIEPGEPPEARRISGLERADDEGGRRVRDRGAPEQEMRSLSLQKIKAHRLSSGCRYRARSRRGLACKCNVLALAPATRGRGYCIGAWMLLSRTT